MNGQCLPAHQFKECHDYFLNVINEETKHLVEVSSHFIFYSSNSSKRRFYRASPSAPTVPGFIAETTGPISITVLAKLSFVILTGETPYRCCVYLVKDASPEK